MIGFLRRNVSWLILAAGAAGLPFFSLSDQEVQWAKMAGPYDEADLAVTIADSPDPVFGSSTAGNLTYVVSVRNNGPDSASGIGVTVGLTLPATGVTIDSVTPSTGTWSSPGWSIPSLAVTATATLTVVLSVAEDAPPASSIDCDALIETLIEFDPDSSDDSDSETTEIARIIRVDCSAVLAPDGDTWATAYDSLVQALEAAEWGDEIWVAQCVYYPDNWAYTDNDVNATFQLQDGVTLYGGFAGGESARNQRDPDANPTILSGDIDGNDSVDQHGITASWTGLAGGNAYHLVTATGTTPGTVLDGFTLTAGWAAGGGVDDDGAAMDCGGAAPTLANLRVVGNRSDYRANLNGCSSAVSTSEFVSNYAGYEASVFAVDTDSLTMVNCLVQGNQSAGAGALLVEDATLSLTNVLFAGNSAGDGAAAVINGVSETSFVNTTVSGNRCLSAGGAVSNNSTDAVTIYNSIFWDNANSNGSGTLEASIRDGAFGKVLVGFSILQGSGGSDAWTGGTLIDDGKNLDEDPLFADPVDPLAAPTNQGNYRLAFASPALDSGFDDANESKTDLDGNERIQGDNIDMGPYEGVFLLFADGFESGGTTAWSASVGN